MGLAIVSSRAHLGMDAPEVAVEVNIAGGLPGMSIVGLAGSRGAREQGPGQEPRCKTAVSIPRGQDHRQSGTG